MRAKHRHNILIRIGITDQGILMHESSKADVHFRSILTLTLTRIALVLLLLNLTLTRIQFLLLLGMLSLREHHLKWSFLEIWRKRDLEDVQEESFLLPCVHICSAPGT